MTRQHIKEIIKLQPSNLENIDISFYDWVDKQLNLYCDTNDGFRKVPVIWASTERAYQLKTEKDIRDTEGALIYPLISIRRESVSKDPERKGAYYGNIPAHDIKGGSIEINKQIVSAKTAAFRNEQQYRRTGQLNFRTKKNDSKSIVYETYSIPMPVYLSIKYTVSIKTNFEQQMNQLIQPFMTRTGGINHFIFGRNGHGYEGFIPKEFTIESNAEKMEKEERFFQTNIEIEALGYVYGSDQNSSTPEVVVSENIVEFKFGRESIVLVDDIEKK